MEIIAHRGASHEAPENTLAAFRLAFEQGADACELDVQLSFEGRIVVFHDFTTWRVAGIDKAVREQTLSDLKLLDVGSWKGPNWAGEAIPTLSEVLPIVPAGKRIFIEIKSGAEILPELSRIISDSSLDPGQFALIGFTLDTMQKTKTWFPDLPVYWLRAFSPEQTRGDPRIVLDPLIEIAVASHFDGLNLLHTAPLDQEFVRKAQAADQKVFVWTVDDTETAREMAKLGVNGISTNRPGLLVSEASLIYPDKSSR